MIIWLRALGTLEQHLGSARQQVELPAGATLRNPLDHAHVRWGDCLPESLWDRQARRFRGSVLIMSDHATMLDESQVLVNGQDILLVEALIGG